MFKQRSFTLIELLVVIAIIGVLAALVMPSINNARTKARDAKRLEDLRQFSSALEMYYSDNNHYPIWEEGGGLSDSGNPLIIGTTSSPAFFTSQYMAKPTGLKDPLPSKYVYYYQSDATGSLYKGVAYMESSANQQEIAAKDSGTASKYYEVFAYKGADQIQLMDDDLDQAMPGYSWPCGADQTKFVFTLDGGWSGGNLGGLSGADTKCQTAAADAGLAGVWKAWLSDSSTSAATRLNHWPGKYVLLDCTVVVNSWDDLTDGSLQHGICMDQNGGECPINRGPWTGTNADGTSAETNCGNWQNDSAYGILGFANYTTSQWTSGTNYNCDNPYQFLICFEQ